MRAWTSRWTRSLTALAVVIASSVVLVINAPLASANDRPGISSVSPIIAQNDSLLGMTSGPGVVINGNGFGDDAPKVTQSPVGGASVGSSAVGVQANTRNLHITDSPTSWFARNSYMGLYPNNDTYGDCYLTIAKWTDSQIIVLLDGTGIYSCNNIGVGDRMRVEVWSTRNGGGFGISLPSGEFNAGDARSRGPLATINEISPASGPTSGGTFGNSNGRITIRGRDFGGTVAVFFGDGGLSGATATTDFTVTPDGNQISVKPPAAPSGTAQGVFITIAKQDSTTQLQCLTVFGGCAGTYYYQSQSNVIPTINTGDINVDHPSGTLSLGGSVEQKNGTCPGAAPSGPTGGSYTASAGIEGGPIAFSGSALTSVNGVLSSIQAPITVRIKNPVKIKLELSGSIAGCKGIPIPKVSIPGVGGLYLLIGGNITGKFEYVITLNKGSFVLDLGYVPGQLRGASVRSENCVDEEGQATDCITTEKTASLAGSIFVSPLFFALDLKAGPAGVTIGAGLTAAATVVTSTNKPFNYDSCLGGTYSVAANLGPLSYTNQGAFFGPKNIYGDGSICPLGEVKTGATSTETTISADPNPGKTASAVTYTATVKAGSSPVTTGTVSFTQDGAVIESCREQSLNSAGVATCPVTYSAAGSYTVSALYAGDSSNKTSRSADLTEVVAQHQVAPPAPRATSVLLVSSSNPAASGTPVTLDATVGIAGELGAVTDNRGTVSFLENGTPIAACTAVPLTKTGGASCARTYEAGGSATITAQYSGDAGFLPSTSGAYAQGVDVKPAITGLSATSGSVYGGNPITITGTGFQKGATAFLRQARSFGPEVDTALTSVVVTGSTTMTAVLPMGTVVGIGDVIVSNQGTVSDRVAADRYAYVMPTGGTPVIRSISPASGPVTGGTTVEVKGTGFAPDSWVGIIKTDNGRTELLPLMGVTVIDSEHLRGYTIGASSPGSGDLVVYTGDFASHSVTKDLFTYIAPGN